MELFFIQIVFRPDPAKFKALRKECDEFLVLVDSSTSLVKNTEGMELQQIVDKVCNWQVKIFRHSLTIFPLNAVDSFTILILLLSD